MPLDTAHVVVFPFIAEGINVAPFKQQFDCILIAKLRCYVQRRPILYLFGIDITTSEGVIYYAGGLPEPQSVGVFIDSVFALTLAPFEKEFHHFL